MQATTDAGQIVAYSENECGLSENAFIFVELFELPGDLQIEVTGDTLEVAAVFDSYQWHLNGTPIPGAIGPVYIITESGSYSLQVSVVGCLDTLGPEQVIFSSIGEIPWKHSLALHPSPATNLVFLDGTTDNALYGISNHLGMNVASGKVKANQVDVNALPAGIYILTIQEDNGFRMGRFCKVK